MKDYTQNSTHLTVAQEVSTIEAGLDSIYVLLYVNGIVNACMFNIPVANDYFVLQTDASGLGLEAVLSVWREGKDLLVALFSHQPNVQLAETRYSATEVESLAVLFMMWCDTLTDNTLNLWASNFKPFTLTVKYAQGNRTPVTTSMVIRRGHPYSEGDVSATPHTNQL